MIEGSDAKGACEREARLKTTFREVKEVAQMLTEAKDAKARTKIRKGSSPKVACLADVFLDQGAFEVWRKLIVEVGEFYRTMDGDLLFFRHADHQLYDLEERAFELYLVYLTAMTAWVRGEALPKFRAWVRFEGPQVAAPLLPTRRQDGPRPAQRVRRVDSGVPADGPRGRRCDRS